MAARISRRAAQNLVSSKLAEIRSHCFYRQYDPVSNPKGIVALAVAENKLMRDEITQHINDHFRITPWHLTYGEGPAGSMALRTNIAQFMNKVFQPLSPVEAQHICMCNGAGSAVSMLGFCVGEPDEGMLVGRPLYVGFFPDIQNQAKIKAVLVSMGTADPTGVEAVQHYEAALQEAQKNGTKIRALLLSSPHNPLGRPYTTEALIGYMKLCQKYQIHLVSDEVYAHSFFPSRDYPHPPPFQSVLAIPDRSAHIDPDLVHVVYGMSKDLCANGIRIGCLVTSNQQVYKAFKSIASFSRPSQLAEHVWLNLLSDHAWLDGSYFPTLQRRMADAYEHCVSSFFRPLAIPYTPACVSSFIWFDLSRYLRDDTLDAEIELNWRMARAGVWLAMGASFAAEKNGFFRLTFASPRHELDLGLARLRTVLHEVEAEKRSDGSWSSS